MRTAGTLITIGIIVAILGMAFGPTTTTTETRCEYTPGYGQDCYDYEVEQPSATGPFLMGIGGFLFGGGFVAWAAARDTEERIMESLNNQNMLKEPEESRSDEKWTGNNVTSDTTDD